MCCGQFWVTLSETKPCTSVGVPATVGHISNGFYQSEKSIDLFLQPGLELSRVEIISGEKKLSAAELLSSISHQSIMWWAAHMYYLIYRLESAATLTSAAGSYQLPQISQRII